MATVTAGQRLGIEARQHVCGEGRDLALRLDAAVRAVGRSVRLAHGAAFFPASVALRTAIFIYSHLASFG